MVAFAVFIVAFHYFNFYTRQSRWKLAIETWVMIDADNLKEVNDKYGHEAGDRLIMSMANTIRNCVRTSDITARYGGDEFVILLPETDPIRALETGDRIRKAIANTSFDAGGNRITSTVSIGIASYPGDGIHTNELLEKADSSLYLSKQSGRNQVRHYSVTRDAGKQEKEDNLASGR